MKFLSKIKKYRKSVGFSLIAIGGIGSALGTSMFLAGGLHGVGIPDSINSTDKVVVWQRVQMGLVGFNETGVLLETLKKTNLIHQTDESIRFWDFINLTKNKYNRLVFKAAINSAQETLDKGEFKGSDGVQAQLGLRSKIDIMDNLLAADSMYDLSIAGIVVMPIGAIILFIGLYLWYSGIAKDKKQTKLFMENLKQSKTLGGQ